jgi:hypothetical protein
VWVSSAENTWHYPNRTIPTEKPMLIFSTDETHVVTIFQKEVPVNAAWFIDGNFVPLQDEFFPQGRIPEQKAVMIHFDNASLHTAETTGNFSCI